ncbi:MAG: diguanylate cyclase [Undibacterium sp.]|nr:diguanylate cyclase [Undibacterium sp.]
MTNSIRSSLANLVIALAIPLVLVVGFNIYQNRAVAIEHAKFSLRSLAMVMATTAERKISHVQEKLQTLATRPLIRIIDQAHCDPLLKEVGTLSADFDSMSYANLQASVLCSSRPLPELRPSEGARLPWLKKTIDSKAFNVGTPYRDSTTGKWLLDLSAPIWDSQNKIVGAMSIALRLESLDPGIPEQQLSPESRYGFFESGGIMIWRNKDPEQVIGTIPNAKAAHQIVATRDGEFESLAIDGVLRFFSVVPMPSSKWVAFIGVPADTVYAKAKNQAITSTCISLIGVGVLFVFAFILARRIERPIHSLALATDAVGEGNFSLLAYPSGPAEIVNLANAFNKSMDKQQRALESLHLSEERLRLVVAATNDGIWDWNPLTQGDFLSPRWKEILGYQDDELANVEATFFNRIHPDDKERVTTQINHHFQKGEAFHVELRMRHKDGSYRWIESRGESLRDAQGKVIRMVGAITDISERKKVQSELMDKEQRLELATFSTGVGIWDWNLQTRELIWSDSMFALYHIQREDYPVTEDAWRKSLHPDDLDRADQAILAAIAGERDFDMELRILWPNNEFRYIRGVAKVFQDEKGEPVRMLGTNIDITALKKLQMRLEHQAHVDYLTGVNNRGYFMEQSEREMKRALRYGEALSLFMLDIDFFKQVNDIHGHKSGDKVLKELARICTSTFRSVDIIGRIGGEEFAILLPETDQEEAMLVAERLRTTINTTVVSLENGLPIHFTVSIGVTALSSREQNIDMLMNCADKALYQAKHTGRNKVCLAMV